MRQAGQARDERRDTRDEAIGWRMEGGTGDAVLKGNGGTGLAVPEG